MFTFFITCKSGDMEKFDAVVYAGHTLHGAEVPFDPATEWGIPPMHLRKGHNAHLVEGTINGRRFQGEIVPRMKKFFLVIDDGTIAGARISGGQTVSITVQPVRAQVHQKESYYQGVPPLSQVPSADKKAWPLLRRRCCCEQARP